MYEDEPDENQSLLIGDCRGALTGKVKTAQIGFIRQDVRKKSTNKNSAAGKRTLTKGVKTKGTKSKRTSR